MEKEKNRSKNSKFDLQSSDTDNLNFEKILKSNSIIFGKMPDDEKTTLYAYDYKNLNFLYRLLQELVKQDNKPPTGAVTIRFPLKLFNLVVDNQSKWKRYFIKSITRLNNTQFLLKNYYNDKNEKVRFQMTQLLAFPKFYSIDNGEASEIQGVTNYDTETKKSVIVQKDVELFEATFPKEIAMSLWQHRGYGYTNIDFKVINGFANKHSINFYEALLSKIQLSMNDLKLFNFVELTKDDISAVFKKSINTKINLNHFLINDLKFKETILPELKRELPIVDFSVRQKDFSITFELDNDRLEEFRINKLTPYQIEMQKFLDLIESETFTNEYSSAYAEASSSLYVVTEDGINRGLEKFLYTMHEKYHDVEFLNDKDREEYGNIVMIKNKGFCNKQTLKPLNRRKSSAFLKFIYTNYYEYIMADIENRNSGGIIIEKVKVGSVFAPFIGEKIILSENEAGIIKNVEQTNDGKIEVMLDVFNRDDREMDIISMALKKFDDIVALTTYIVENKKLQGS